MLYLFKRKKNPQPHKPRQPHVAAAGEQASCSGWPAGRQQLQLRRGSVDPWTPAAARVTPAGGDPRPVLPHGGGTISVGGAPRVSPLHQRRRQQQPVIGARAPAAVVDVVGRMSSGGGKPSATYAREREGEGDRDAEENGCGERERHDHRGYNTKRLCVVFRVPYKLKN